MFFDGTEHTTGLLHKFFIVYGKMFFLVDSYPKCTINSGMHHNSILIHLFFSTLIFSLMMLSELMKLLSTHHVTNHLTCRNKPMSCNLVLKLWKCNIRNIGKFNFASNYILIFGKSFYISKLNHIDLKRRILIASFLLAPLLNKKC